MKKFSHFIILALIISVSVLSLPMVYAEEQPLSEATLKVTDILKLPGEDQPLEYFSDQKYSPLVAFILKIINYATAIIGSIAIILFIMAGFMFMVSQGNQTQLDKAKDVFKYAIIGLVVTFTSYIIVIFVQSLFIAE